MPEVCIKKPMWIDGKPVEPDTVVNLPESEAVYQIGLGRAERIVSAVETLPSDEPEPEAAEPQ